MPIFAVEQIVDGEKVVINVEMDEPSRAKGVYEGVRDGSQVGNKVIVAARDVFGDSMQLARSCATRVVHDMKEVSSVERPDEFEVQFAIKLDSEVGAIIAKMGAEAQLQVTMTWKQQAAK